MARKKSYDGLSPEHLEYITKNHKGMSNAEMSLVIGIDAKIIYKELKILGFKAAVKKTSQRKSTLNEALFFGKSPIGLDIQPFINNVIKVSNE